LPYMRWQEMRYKLHKYQRSDIISWRAMVLALD
jgi:hypothetical protein